MAESHGLHTLTHNGALTFASSNSCLVDFFFKIVRDTPEEDIFKLLQECWKSYPLETLKLIFHLRDTRGGKGEKKAFYSCLIWLEAFHPCSLMKNFDNIPEYGYFKDFYCLIDSSLEVYVINYLCEKLKEDLSKEVEERSLCSKWLPSENCSLDKKYGLVKKMCKTLGMTKKEYRKTIVKMREGLNIVEISMCRNNWDNIDYSKVSSLAFNRYKKAFKKHSPEHFEEFLSKVKEGVAKINTSRLFPHDIISQCWRSEYDETIELQWEQFLKSLDIRNLGNSIAVVDVSGSMTSQVGNTTALMIAISLGMICAQLAQGPFKDKWITFSGSPTLESLNGNTLKEKIQNMSTTQWEMNTNLQAVFQLILSFAILYNVPQENLPKTIFIFSDMQFDEACSNNKTNFEAIEDMYMTYNYRRPKIVFWKIDSKNNDCPIKYDENNCALLSGYSPELMKMIIEGEEISPLTVVMNVINSPRYSRVVL